MGFHSGTTNGAQLYRSTSAGAAWTNITANLPNAPANSVAVDPNDANTVYVAMDTGVYVTTAVTTCISANCWSVYGSALPNSPVVQLQAAAAMPTGDGRLGELRAATYGRGIWQIPLLTAIAAAAPAMAISPASVTYASEQVGTASVPQTVLVTNTGSAPLLVSSVTTTGDFSETDTCAGATVAQNATCAVQVEFTPAATGARSGVLTVYGNVSGGQAVATLSGTGVAGAAIVLTPLTLAFPATGVGAASTAQAIVVANTGGSVASLQTPVITGDFTISGNTCATALGANVGCTISIEFTPTAAGARSGTLTITDSAGTQVASLSGTGTNPATDALSPAGLAFAAQQLNTASASQSVTLLNAGDVALTQIGAQITSGDFAVLNNCGPTLIARASCTLSVTYSPKSVGAETGVLTVTDEFRSQTVALSGTGLAPPGVSLSPVNGLAFGAVGLGMSGTAQAVTLTNNGGVALAIANVSAGGDYSVAAGSNTCGSSVAPGAVCSVQVVFTPTVAGVRTGTVTFSDNASNSPQSVSLSGTGIDFSLAANGPTSLTIASGQTATYALLLTSLAGLPGSAAFTCSGVPAHTLCTVNPGSAALGGTTNVSVTVATGLASVEMHAPVMPWDGRAVWFALAVPLVWMGRRRGLGRMLPLALLLAVTACGTSRTVPSSSTSSPLTTATTTPTGTYTLVVAGSSAGLVRSVNLTLVVQ